MTKSWFTESTSINLHHDIFDTPLSKTFLKNMNQVGIAFQFTRLNLLDRLGSINKVSKDKFYLSVLAAAML
ncbi:MAG TPA: hypothetical protein VE594_01145 [Nitrososphaeraceae archaeon]|nr:hypothetical protein [Nitrososphaeraceae archaeon]